jgi:hypothetical protein
MSRATLPFVLGVEVPRTGAADLVIQIDVNSTDPAVARPYQEIIELFIRAVRSQVLPTVGREDSSWQGSAPPFDARQRLISATALVKGLAPEAYLVLVALLAQSALAETPPKYVHIASKGTADVIGLQGLSWERLQTDDLPVRIEHAGDGELLEVNLEFSSPLPPELMPGLDEAFTVWDHLVFLGGYRFSFEPDDDFAVVLGDTTQPTRTAVRHVIDSFRGPLLALDGPLRLCRHLVRHGYPVKEILFES